MTLIVRSFAKINIGLAIGPKRDDGFHELLTVYQTIALHDLVKVEIKSGTGIEIRSKNKCVPQDESNTCWRIAERTMRALNQRGRVVITIEKQLPVQGGLGAASSNGVATLFAIEKLLKRQLAPDERLRIAAKVGSDLPLFLSGGTTLGLGRGEQVLPLQDVPKLSCVIITPDVGVSTPKAFADWDALTEQQSRLSASGRRYETQDPATAAALPSPAPSDTINRLGHALGVWLCGSASGASAKGGSQAEKLLLDLVRAGIENGFEKAVFRSHPELREIKSLLQPGNSYASLSGSGSTLYGLYASGEEAKQALKRVQAAGYRAQLTTTLTRAEYRRRLFAK